VRIAYLSELTLCLAMPPSESMKTAATQPELLDLLDGKSCVLVPTMGYLHDGHLSLVRKAKKYSLEHDIPSVATIFVNPTQFNEPSDLAKYPRDIERDKCFLEAEGLDVVYIPAVDEVYPPGLDCTVPLPEVATKPRLEDEHRPGHFEGVCQVLVRLFEMCNTEAAVFGEKDWQQLQVARAIVKQQGMDIQILPGETIRESDGLAMSSRNVHLDEREYAQALAINRAIREGGQERDWQRAELHMKRILEDAEMSVDYAVVREASVLTLNPDEAPGMEYRCVITARSGGVRLLDNGPWPV
jgi:pantoate--beta-alanine ligase